MDDWRECVQHRQADRDTKCLQRINHETIIVSFSSHQLLLYLTHLLLGPQMHNCISYLGPDLLKSQIRGAKFCAPAKVLRVLLAHAKRVIY